MPPSRKIFGIFTIILVCSLSIPAMYYFSKNNSIKNDFFYPIFINYYTTDIVSAIQTGSEFLKNLQLPCGLYNISNISHPLPETKVYSHSIIFDTLLNVKSINANITNSSIDKAINYLFSIQSNNSCWNFFPTLVPDCDDTSLALIALLETHNNSFNLSDSVTNMTLARLQSGHFNTWIYNNSFSEGPEFVMVDPAIDATVLNALWLYNRTYYADIIDEGILLLENNQTDDGYWVSNFWYTNGPFYTLYMINRILSLAKPNSDCLSKSYNYIIKNQKFDGSWSRGGKFSSGNSLDTALALLSLYYLSLAGYEVKNSVVRGINYLLKTQSSDGTWPAEILWVEDFYKYNITYEKFEITTAFAVKSLYLCLNLTSGWKSTIIIPNSIILFAYL